MNITFWGGCLNRQRNIPPEKHYHHIVSKHLQLGTGELPGKSLRFYSSYHELKEEVGVSIKGESHIDYLIIFLRPYTLMPLTKPLIRYTDKHIKMKMALHPKFTRHSYHQNMAKEYKVRPATNESNGTLHQLFQKLNDRVGDFLNLPEWSVSEVIRILDALNEQLSAKGTKLIIAGPILYPGNSRINNVCKELDRMVSLFCLAKGVAHVGMTMPTDMHGNPILNQDNKHITEAGHAMMAEGILAAIQISAKQVAKLL